MKPEPNINDVNYVVDYIQNPKLIKNVHEFVDLLVRCKHKEITRALINAIANYNAEPSGIWVSQYLYALCEITERPFHDDCKSFPLFINKLTSLVENKNSYEAAWYSASLLGKIDHPMCNAARLKAVGDASLFIDGRIACLRGIVEYHTKDQASQVLNNFAGDTSSPLHSLANAVLNDMCQC